jgi:hypothetical protein
MTIQLTKEQIDAIKVELRKYGLNVLPLPGRGKAKAARVIVDGGDLEQRIARVQAMKFKTAGVKAAILRTLKLAKRCRDWNAANPVSIGDLLPMFGVRLQDVQPWPETAGFEQRWQALRNGSGTRLTLPAPKARLLRPYIAKGCEA